MQILQESDAADTAQLARLALGAQVRFLVVERFFLDLAQIIVVVAQFIARCIGLERRFGELVVLRHVEELRRGEEIGSGAGQLGLRHDVLSLLELQLAAGKFVGTIDLAAAGLGQAQFQRHQFLLEGEAAQRMREQVGAGLDLGQR